MGCNMHTFIEYKKQSDTEWQDGNFYTKDKDGFNRIFMKSESRDYSLFTALANVRGTGGICDPRGLPNDVSKEVFLTIGSWGRDAHSTSYFTFAELLIHVLNYPILQELVDELNYYRTVLNYRINPHNIRIIFWFDN